MFEFPEQDDERDYTHYWVRTERKWSGQAVCAYCHLRVMALVSLQGALPRALLCPQCDNRTMVPEEYLSGIEALRCETCSAEWWEGIVPGREDDDRKCPRCRMGTVVDNDAAMN